MVGPGCVEGGTRTQTIWFLGRVKTLGELMVKAIGVVWITQYDHVSSIEYMMDRGPVLLRG